jgi:hypothetical protein
MGTRSRRKGADGEREIVQLARAHGLPAERTWHLAQSHDAAERASDVRIAGEAYQVKRSCDGFQQLYDGLAHVAGLFIRADGPPWLAVLPATRLLELLTRSDTQPGGRRASPL